MQQNAPPHETPDDLAINRMLRAKCELHETILQSRQLIDEGRALIELADRLLKRDPWMVMGERDEMAETFGTAAAFTEG